MKDERFLSPETPVAALLWAVLVIGAAVLALTIPVFTSAASQALGIPETVGLPASEVLRLSGNVRAMVADAEFDRLPATVDGMPAFDEAAVSHLQDVRRVLAAVRLSVGVLALLLATYVGFSVSRRRFDALAWGMLAGALLVSALTVLAVVVALFGFEAFFAAFHGVFFAAGTWTFPADSLLIRLFPERFWMAAGGSWAALSLVGAFVLATCAHFLHQGVVRRGASRTGNNV